MAFGDLKLDLDSAEERRARDLHARSLVIDLMFQGPCGYRSLGGDLLTAEKDAWKVTGSGKIFTDCLSRISELAGEGRLPDYEEIWRDSGITASNLQVIGEIENGDHERRLRELQRFPWYRQALAPEDIRAAKRAGTHVSFLNYQYLPTSIDNIAWFDRAYEIGLRMAGLTYNHKNQFGAGCTSEDEGLTEFGRSAVARMNELGIIVDVAHAGKRTTLDACRYSKKPVIASHTSSEVLFPHVRNKSDEEFRALADTGGVCGVFVVPVLLTKDLPGHLDLTLDHIDYLANKFGIDFVAIGTDWPMQLPKWVLEIGGPFKQWCADMGFADDDVPRPDLNLEGFDDYRDFPNITRGLVKRGFTDEEIEKILGLNALRVIDEVWS